MRLNALLSSRIVCLAAAATLCSGGLPSLASAQGVKRHALLIACTKYDNLDERSHLHGPANDVVLFRKLLEDRYSVEPKAIVTLAEGQAGATTRPTWKNIEREFKALADRNKVKPGDQVIILMGGHGYYVPNDNPSEEDPEPDGYDEVFLPADCGLWNSSAKTIPNCIRDDDLGKWLNDIRRTGAFVWFIADSCHSGTIQRDIRATGEVNRELQRTDLGIDNNDATFRPVGQQRGASGGSELIDGAPRGGIGKLVAIYAALSSEPTVELPLPYETNEGQRKPYGLLTFTISQILTRATSTLSYGELIERIGQQYRAWGRRSPTPQAEGDGMAEGVLSIARGGALPGASSGTRSLNAYFLEDAPGNTFTVKAGTLHGLSPNCILAVHPKPGEGDQILGYVVVQECLPMECIVKPCEFKKLPAVEKAKLPIGGRVELAWVDYAGLKPLRVAIDAAGQDAASPNIDPAALTLGIPAGMVEVSKELTNAQWVIRVRNGRASLMPISDWAKLPIEESIPSADAKLPSDFGPVVVNADGERTLSTTLRRIAHAKNLLSVTEAADGGRFSASGVNVKLEFRRHKDRNDMEGVPLDTTSGRPTPFVEPGEMVGVRLTNQGTDDIYVTLLYVDSNYKTTKWYPRRGNLPDRLSRKESLGAPAIPRATVTDDTWGLEHFVAIAVRAEGQPQDFGWLAEETIEGARGTTRGDNSPLTQLFQYAAYRQGAARGAAAEDGTASCIRSIAWNVAPPQAK
jgi:hypothetical protein